MKLTYHWEGDYLIPDLVAPESPMIGIWGERRRRFLRTHRKPLYDGMMMEGRLNAHLLEVDRNAEEMLDRLIVQMAEREGITEARKASDQMAWVQRMNNIRSCVEEIVMTTENRNFLCRTFSVPYLSKSRFSFDTSSQKRLRNVMTLFRLFRPFVFFPR